MVALTVVVLLGIKSSHLKRTIASCSSLCIRAMARCKETEELRAISVDHATGKCRSSRINERKNTLTRGQGMASTSLHANLAVNDTNDGSDTPGCTTRDRIANGVDLKFAQVIFNVAMALTFAIDRTSGLNGITPQAGRMRREHIGNGFVKDAQLRC